MEIQSYSNRPEGACTFAKDHQPLRVAAKVGNIVVGKVEGALLILYAKVARGVQRSFAAQELRGVE